MLSRTRPISPFPSQHFGADAKAARCDTYLDCTMTPQRQSDECYAGNQAATCESQPYHFLVSMNGSVEIEIRTEAPMEPVANASVVAVDGADEPNYGPHLGQAGSDACSHACVTPDRKRCLPTATPHSSPADRATSCHEEEKYPSPLRTDPADVEARAHQLMECLRRMDDESNEAERRAAAAAASAGIESALAAMKRHKAKSRVQRYGCGVLYQLACQNETNKHLIMESGGVEAILTAMQCHLTNAGVQDCGCLALDTLCKATEGGGLIVRSLGIETILAGMRGHIENAAVQKSGCLVLLGIASSHPDHNAGLAKAGGITVVMEAITRHPGDPGIREFGGAVLWSLTYMNSKNAAAINEVGGIDAVFEVMGYMKGKETLPSSREDQCLELFRQRGRERESVLEARPVKRDGVAAILSVFVRPLQ